MGKSPNTHRIRLTVEFCATRAIFRVFKSASLQHPVASAHAPPAPPHCCCAACHRTRTCTRWRSQMYGPILERATPHVARVPKKASAGACVFVGFSLNQPRTRCPQKRTRPNESPQSKPGDSTESTQPRRSGLSDLLYLFWRKDGDVFV